MNIEKKLWPEYFEKILSGEKDYELRLADFEINEGDNLILKEFNPENKTYTGRVLAKNVQAVVKFGAEDIGINGDEGIYKNYSEEQLNKFGYYWIGLG